MSVLVATGLRLGFGGRVVLDGFGLRLERGQQCALVGRSGSGKTTLLLVLAGLLAPDAGRVDRAPDAGEVVYVPQAPSLIPELSALQNASLGLRIRGVRPAQAQERAAEVLHLLQLGGAEDALPAELSGGMQQRVALARALAVEPGLLLADEPTGALDQATGRMVIDVLTDQVKQSGAALLVATHDRHVAARFERQLSLDLESSR